MFCYTLQTCFIIQPPKRLQYRRATYMLSWANPGSLRRDTARKALRGSIAALMEPSVRGGNSEGMVTLIGLLVKWNTSPKGLAWFPEGSHPRNTPEGDSMYHPVYQYTKSNRSQRKRSDQSTAARGGAALASLGLSNFCEVGMLRLRYKSVNLREKTCPSSPNSTKKRDLPQVPQLLYSPNLILLARMGPLISNKFCQAFEFERLGRRKWLVDLANQNSYCQGWLEGASLKWGWDQG